MVSERNPDLTRSLLLQSAYTEIHLHGFQGASVDAILARTGLTKGALYHHFPNKLALGYAVVEEVIAAEVYRRWLAPLEGQTDPITAFMQALHDAAAQADLETITLGCPLNNLAQEMSPLDEGFRMRLEQVFAAWRKGLIQAFELGQRHGTVRRDVDAGAVAVFVLAAMEGCIGMAKNAQSLELLHQCGLGLQSYLASLRP